MGRARNTLVLRAAGTSVAQRPGMTIRPMKWCCTSLCLVLLGNTALAQPQDSEPAPLVRRSKAAFATGLVLTAAGATLAVGGLIMQGQTVDDCSYDFCEIYDQRATLRRHQLGLVFAIAGLALAAVGVPLVFYGGAKVPRATLVLGPGGASFTARF